IGRCDLEEDALQKTRERDRGDQADRAAGEKKLHSVGEDQGADLIGTGAQCESDADFANTLECCVGKKPVQSDGSQRERETGEKGEKETKEALRAPSFFDALDHRTSVENGLRR